jgi:hypothetical protein
MARRHQPFWCEENVWHLCQEPDLADQRRQVAVITGAGGHVAIWQQRAAAPGAPVAWDYHVILLALATAWEVWDLDTRLPCPVAAEDYLARSFPAPGRVPVDLQPRFRLLPAEQYVAELSSDRSHMRRADGGYRQPPPPWPPPGAGRAPNLARFIDPADPFLGERCDLAGLRRSLALDGP